MSKAKGERFVIFHETFEFHKIAYDYNYATERFEPYAFSKLTEAELKLLSFIQGKILTFFQTIQRQQITSQSEKYSLIDSLNDGKVGPSTTLPMASLGDYFAWLLINNSSCGSGGNAPYVPDYPFREACDNHDTCYSTYTARQVCDRRFRDHMDTISKQKSGWSDNEIPTHLDPRFQLYVLMQSIAAIYEEVVVRVGLNAYCQTKEDENYCLEIDGNYPPPGSNSGPYGTGTGQPSGGPGGIGPGDGGGNTGGGDGGYLSCTMTVHGQVCTSGGCTYWTETKAC